MFKKLLLVVSVFTLSACESFTADRYVPNSTNQAALKSVGGSKKVSVSAFTVANAESVDVACRLAGPIQVAGTGKHEEYIQKAFIDELQSAGLYSPSSSKRYNAQIKSLSVATVSPASWNISGDFFVNNRFLKEVTTKFPFKTSYSAMGACNNAAENFPYAVEDFIGSFIKSSEFKRSL